MGKVAQAGMGLFTGLFGLSNAANEADALEAQGRYEQQIFNSNAKRLEEQALDVERIGSEEAASYGEKVRSTVGAQRASYAAQGVEVSTASASEVQQETVAKGNQDMLTIKDNAWREAFGMKQEANNLRRQGALAAMGRRGQASSTLATGGLRFLDRMVDVGSNLYSPKKGK